MIPYDRIWAEIDLDAVEQNMKAMREILPEKTGMLGVVKADAYGHGAVQIAKAIDPYVQGFAVATAQEGVSLRRNGITKRILVLGVTMPQSNPLLVEYDICPAIFTVEQASALSELALAAGKRLRVHLALDTGMSRIGMEPNESGIETALAISKFPGLLVEGMFTHFARADEEDKCAATAQLEKYVSFERELRERGLSIPLRHCSNSAGILEGMDSNTMELVRAGISIYGLSPSDEVGKCFPFAPVLSFRAAVTFVKTIAPGSAVSYGGTFVADRPLRVATVAAGYGDGYSRNLSGKADVLIRGKRARILGRVCMDQFMVDVTDIPGVSAGDTVTLIGRDGDERVAVEELARLGGGFHYEIVCDIGKRVPRVYLRGGQVVETKDYFGE